LGWSEKGGSVSAEPPFSLYGSEIDEDLGEEAGGVNPSPSRSVGTPFATGQH